MKQARHTKPRLAGTLVLATALVAGCAGLGGPEAPEREPAAPAVEISPADQALFGEAAAALRAGNADLAARRFGELATKHPDLAAAHANQGLAAMQAGDDEAAIAAMVRAVELRPGNASWQNRLGVLLRRNGEFERAEEAYQAALSADNAYANAHLNLGILYDVYLQRPEQALSHYRQYQTLSGQPDDEVALWITDLERRL